MPQGSAICALLGPTNTGKTHRAIERMLNYPSGMIGLPLRLLAREVYDRVSTEVGQSRVALITGEEKRVPRRADYWVCTVEAMPISLDCEFLAVDEVQLASHDQRGHVFTDRLLHARGTNETYFLGSDTMKPIVEQILPTAQIIQHPRLSKLSYVGPQSLSQLPSRSAVVAFSLTQVYELADRLRVSRGGCAIVLGALSPRARNAQVAMFQSGEVDYLVATDAIGMGLNLDVAHVAFAATRKFDGQSVRDVEDAELGQIAGRAGRYVRDGTFGVLHPLDLPVSVARAIEHQKFSPVKRIRWRNSDLNYSSLDALRASLKVPPKQPLLVATADNDDMHALEMLAAKQSIKERTVNSDSVKLLWEICSIPDFRKLLFEAHAAQLEEIFLELSSRGRLSNDWLQQRVSRLSDTVGDADDLLAKLTAMRTWSYVSNQSEWLQSPQEWQEKTRAIEDQLSDALHTKLVARFVENNARRINVGNQQQRSAKAQRAINAAHAVKPNRADDQAIDQSHPFAGLANLRGTIKGPKEVPSQTAEREQWAHQLADAPHEAFSLNSKGEISSNHQVLGRVRAGTSLSLADVQLNEHLPTIGAGAKLRLHRRLLAFVRDQALTPLLQLDTLRTHASPTVRGLFRSLERTLGTLLLRDVLDVVTSLTESERQKLTDSGVCVGKCTVYLSSVFDPALLPTRIALVYTYYDIDRRQLSLTVQSPTLAVHNTIDPKAYLSLGYGVFGPLAVRVDLVEKIADLLTQPQRVSPKTYASVLQCPVATALKVANVIAQTMDECTTQKLNVDEIK